MPAMMMGKKRKKVKGKKRVLPVQQMSANRPHHNFLKNRE